jgi:hypothetical protein
MVRAGFVASVVLFVVAMLTSGCSHSSAQAPTPAQQVEITVHPWKKQVRFVGKTPPKARFAYVGRVRGEAPDIDFVRAVEQARAQIAERAEALGADTVKIDVIAPSSSNHIVMLAGRAYRAVD